MELLDDLDKVALKLNGRDMSKKPWRCPACSHLRIGDCLRERCPAQWNWKPGVDHLKCGGRINILLGVYGRRCWCNVFT